MLKIQTHDSNRKKKRQRILLDIAPIGHRCRDYFLRRFCQWFQLGISIVLFRCPLFIVCIRDIWPVVAETKTVRRGKLHHPLLGNGAFVFYPVPASRLGDNATYMSGIQGMLGFLE